MKKFFALALILALALSLTACGGADTPVNADPTPNASKTGSASNGTATTSANNQSSDAGSHLLSFVNNGSSLDADLADAYTTINWAVTFYPKGVANNLDPNNGVKVDNTKNLIVIWYSGMQVLTVFAQTDTSS